MSTDNQLEGRYETIISALRSHVLTRGEHVAYTFLASDEERRTYTYRQLDARARGIARELLNHASPGDRALMAYPAGLEFIEAFLGCLYAGIIAIPAYPPKKNRNANRILAIAHDCQPELFLCTTAACSNVKGDFADAVPGSTVLATEEMGQQVGSDVSGLPEIQPDQLAFVQYTSGSTAAPKGVMVSHGNIVANERLIQKRSEYDHASVLVSWLPMFHDMGLIGGVLSPLYVGYPSVLMAPTTFLRDPYLWLQAISEFRGTTTGAPNFAYDLCVRRITVDQKRSLDLSSLKVAKNGAEPIRADTLKRFSEAFAVCGFRAEAFFPCYGMAEATLFVSGGRPLKKRTVLSIDVAAMEKHRLVDAPDGQRLVSCGEVGPDLEVRIVDPETQVECSSAEIGEIWVSGDSVAQGYLDRPEETQETFRAKLAGDGRHWLRTGDYGFLRNDELFVSGRLKDLIIIRGRNIYPQDIEHVVEEHLDFVEPNTCSAFSVPMDGDEALIIVAEGTREMVRWSRSGANGNGEAADLHRAIDRLRSAILDQFDVVLQVLVFVRPTTFPRTSSGKVQRRLSRANYIDQSAEIVFCSTLALGVDSLAAVSLTLALERGLGRTLPQEILFRYSSINELATFPGSAVNAANHEVRVSHAVAERDLEAVYRFRYAIYVEEMNRTQHYADHARRRIVDPLDLTADTFAVWDGDQVVATLRVNLLRRNPLDFYRAIYGITNLTREEVAKSSISTRFMAAPEVRQSPLVSRLLATVYEHGLRHQVEHDYCDCNDHLVVFFERIGYHVVHRISHPEYGDVTVMRLDLLDLPHLEKVQSPLVGVLQNFLADPKHQTTKSS